MCSIHTTVTYHYDPYCLPLIFPLTSDIGVTHEMVTIFVKRSRLVEATASDQAEDLDGERRNCAVARSSTHGFG